MRVPLPQPTRAPALAAPGIAGRLRVALAGGGHRAHHTGQVRLAMSTIVGFAGPMHTDNSGPGAPDTTASPADAP